MKLNIREATHVMFQFWPDSDWVLAHPTWPNGRPNLVGFLLAASRKLTRVTIFPFSSFPLGPLLQISAMQKVGSIIYLRLILRIYIHTTIDTCVLTHQCPKKNILSRSCKERIFKVLLLLCIVGQKKTEGEKLRTNAGRIVIANA